MRITLKYPLHTDQANKRVLKIEDNFKIYICNYENISRSIPTGISCVKIGWIATRNG